MNSGSESPRRARVLIVDRDDAAARLAHKTLTAGHCVPERAADLAGARLAVASGTFDVLLVDLETVGLAGVVLLRRTDLPENEPHIVVSVSAGRQRDAIPALWSGALTYIRKPYDADELLLTVERARADLECRREVAALRARLRSSPDLPEAPWVPVTSMGAAEMGWSLAQLERHHILRTLDLCSGNQSRAAAVLGVDRRTLYRKLKEYRIAEPASVPMKRRLAS